MSAPDPPRKLPLPLPAAASSARADLIADDSNAAALAWLYRPGDWPNHCLAMFGRDGTGKSHMLRAAAGFDIAAVIVPGRRMAKAPCTRPPADPRPGESETTAVGISYKRFVRISFRRKMRSESEI